MGVRQLAFLNEADLRRRRFFVASADQHSKISARAPRNGNAATLRTHQVGSRHVRCATPGASPAPKVCGSSGNFREDVTISLSSCAQLGWEISCCDSSKSASVGCPGWGCTRDQRTGGLVGVFPKDTDTCHCMISCSITSAGVVVSDLLTVEGV